MNKRNKKILLALGSLFLIGGSLVVAQLLISIQNTGNFQLATHQLQWVDEWYNEIDPLTLIPVADFSACGGVISGEGNTTVTFSSIKYFPNMEITYELVAIEYLFYGSGVLDCTWIGHDIAVGAGDLDYILIEYGETNTVPAFFPILEWNSTGHCNNLADYDIPSDMRFLLIRVTFQWLTSNTLPFTFEVLSESG